MNLSKHRQFLFSLLLFLSIKSYSQKISCAEKWWALKHFCKAKKALKISEQVQQFTAEVLKDSILIGSGNGLQVDAFRHTYWMAVLTQNIGAKRAYRLGKAHERGAYRAYKKNRKEDGTVPDKISSTMDLYNNNIGIEIGKTYQGSDLKQAVINDVKQGKCKIMKVDANGNYLDENNKIIPLETLIGTWKNNKVLVNSNYKQ